MALLEDTLEAKERAEKMLAIYRAVQAYTIEGIESAINNLDKSIDTDQNGLVDVLRQRKEELENYLEKVKNDINF